MSREPSVIDNALRVFATPAREPQAPAKSGAAPEPVPVPVIAETPGWRGRPPVILQLIPALRAGGAERGCVDVAIATRNSGATPIVASSGGQMVAELQRAGITHLELRLDTKSPWQIWRNAAQIARIIRQYKVDIVHVRSRAPAWAGWIACRRTGAHFMSTFHAAYKFKGVWKKRYNAIMTRGKRVIAISEFIRQHIIENYGTQADKIVTIPRGVDLNRFDPEKINALRMMDLAKSWHIPDDVLMIICPGRLTRIKGHETLIRAMAALGRRDICCVIIGAAHGRDGYRQELEALIETLNLGGIVKLVDHCSDMPAAYRLASIVVAPSIVSEGFGRVPVEAQAMERLVIATDLGGFRETVKDVGWLVPPGDVAALLEALRDALSLDGETRAALAQAARQRVLDLYSNDQMCAATLQVYREILA